MRLFKILPSKIDWLILLPLIFIPRLLNPDVFLTADEPLFLEHAREFAAGLAGDDFSQTLGIGYPGVTVAGWSAPLVGLAQSEMEAYAAGRMATATMTGILLLMLYGFAKALLGQQPAFIGMVLLALDPYTLAYSRLFHIEAPLALFMTLAGLSALLWLHDTRRRWLLLTGLFCGLALLTKSTALLLAPMLGAIVFGWGLATGQWRVGGWWLRSLGAGLAILALSSLIFVALWPAMWTTPAEALSLTFGKLFRDQEAGTGNLGLFWLGRFVDDPGPAFYPVAFILKSTPWLLAGLIFSLIQIFKSDVSLPLSNSKFFQKPEPKPKTPKPQTSNPKPQTQNPKPETQNPKPITHNSAKGTQAKLITISLWLFTFTYLIIMTIASKKSIRYLLPAFPPFYLLAGLAYYKTALAIKSSKNYQLPITIPRSLLLTLLILTAFTFIYHPYYFTYYNPLLLGWRWAPHTLLVGWGEGLDGAARYLNEHPGGSVSAWYEWLFPILYNGPVQAVVPQENLITADRTVLYINQVQRDIPGPNIIHYFQTRRRPEHTVRLAGIDYAWVYPGPIAGFDRQPAPQIPLSADFGGETHLLGYDQSANPISGGESLIVTLYWKALTTPPPERFVFLRLVDRQGHIWARADSPPVMGLWPVTRWQPGMLIEDAHELPIPAGTPPGLYQLEIGIYDPTNGQPLPAAGGSLGQGGGLLVGEIQVGWRPSTDKPDLPFTTNIRLAPNARLVGYDKPPAKATTGDIFTIPLAWRESSTFSAWLFQPYNDWVMFEWRWNGQRLAEQLDPLPMPLEQWGRGTLMLSQHNLITPPNLDSGRYEVAVILHNGSDPAGEAFILGMVDVTAPSHQFDLPAGALAPDGWTQLTTPTGGIIELMSYTAKVAGNGIDVNLYWQTDAPLTTGYKVFAQLLAADNSLAAQSDAVPAAGQRPTPGWLPGEIITDPHRLTFSGEIIPAGTYRLIAGLYNPLDGQRIPILNESGDPIADAIFITEVTLP